MILGAVLAYFIAGIASARWFRHIADFYGEEDIIIAAVIFWPVLWTGYAIVRMVRA